MRRVAPVLLAASSAAAQPANDNCAAASPIVGYATIAFDNTLATTDGPAFSNCNGSGAAATITHDVWYCWTAPESAWVSIRTCYLTAVDTKFAVYRGCACPGALGNFVTCGDDGCGSQSQSFFVAHAGQTYLIRLGSTPGAPGGTGQIAIEPRIVAGPITNPATQRAYYLLSPSWPGGYHGIDGTLAAIRTAEENEFIRAQVIRFDQQDRDAWIGFYEPAGSSVFVWGNGVCLGYANWAPGEPSNPSVQRWSFMSSASGQWSTSPEVPAAPIYSVIESPRLAWDCYADCNQDRVLNVNDFVCFQATFAAWGCDCNHDSVCNVLDFICFQQAFAAGCSCL